MIRLSLDFGNANGISKEENLNVHIPVQSTDFRRQNFLLNIILCKALCFIICISCKVIYNSEQFKQGKLSNYDASMLWNIIKPFNINLVTCVIGK